MQPARERVVELESDDADAGTHEAKGAPPLDHATIRAIVAGIMLAMFLSALEQTIVAPALPAIGKSLGDIDNLSSHKQPAVRQAIEATGATLLFLPAYSPDFNLIEQVFAKLKALLRKMALRSIDALWNALGSITGCVSADEAKNFIRHAGYFQSQ